MINPRPVAFCAAAFFSCYSLAMDYPDYLHRFEQESGDSYVSELDGGTSKTRFYSSFSGRVPSPVDGISIQWNYSGYSASKQADDWSYPAFTNYDRFHPENHPDLAKGYVYMHAVVTNTNDHGVALGFNAPQIDLAFDLIKLNWQPEQNATRVGSVENAGSFYRDLDYCHFEKVAQYSKNKIISQLPNGQSTEAYKPATSVRYFEYSLANNEVGKELPQKHGITGLRAGESMLVKWYAQETPTPGQKFLPMGALPEASGCVPRELVPEFYEKCGGKKLNINFFNFCSDSRDDSGRLVFNYFSASNFGVFLAEDPTLRVRNISSGFVTKKNYAMKGKKTRGQQ